LARRQMPGGFGGMMSFVVEGSSAEARFKRAQSVLRNVRLCPSAASFGGTETLITPPRLDELPAPIARPSCPPRPRAGPFAALRGSRASPGYRGRSHVCAFGDRVTSGGQRADLVDESEPRGGRRMAQNASVLTVRSRC